MATYLPPVEKPRGLFLKVMYFFMRRQFGKVMTPITVFSARMPFAFMSFYGKVSRLDKKLRLPSLTAVLIRERVASINSCQFCMDAARWSAMKESMENAARFDALSEYRTSPLFSDAERAALDYATELTRDRNVNPDTFAQLARYYDGREICDIVWLVASEHLYNMSNIGLNIGSDGLCELSPTSGSSSPTMVA
jgi:alkylhydroperoxidase family enzyme